MENTTQACWGTANPRVLEMPLPLAEMAMQDNLELPPLPNLRDPLIANPGPTHWFFCYLYKKFLIQAFTRRVFHSSRILLHDAFSKPLSKEGSKDPPSYQHNHQRASTDTLDKLPMLRTCTAKGFDTKNWQPSLDCIL